MEVFSARPERVDYYLPTVPGASSPCQQPPFLVAFLRPLCLRRFLASRRLEGAVKIPTLSSSPLWTTSFLRRADDCQLCWFFWLTV